MKTFAFANENRITKSQTFRDLSQSPQKWVSPYFVVLCRPSQTQSARIGITVSRKCSKKAVERNRIKRLIRESFRLNKAKIPLFDMVVIARVQAATADNQVLLKDLETVWGKLTRFVVTV